MDILKYTLPFIAFAALMLVVLMPIVHLQKKKGTYRGRWLIITYFVITGLFLAVITLLLRGDMGVLFIPVADVVIPLTLLLAFLTAHLYGKYGGKTAIIGFLIGSVLMLGIAFLGVQLFYDIAEKYVAAGKAGEISEREYVETDPTMRFLVKLIRLQTFGKF